MLNMIIPKYWFHIVVWVYKMQQVLIVCLKSSSFWVMYVNMHMDVCITNFHMIWRWFNLKYVDDFYMQILYILG